MYTTTTPEAKTREGIDAQLQAACWLIQYLGQRTSTGGVALSESSGDTGRADYILYLHSKRFDHSLEGVQEQSATYAAFRNWSDPDAVSTHAEQHQIVSEVEAHTTSIYQLCAELDRQITRSYRFRQSTLASAFSGAL